MGRVRRSRFRHLPTHADRSRSEGQGPAAKFHVKHCLSVLWLNPTEQTADDCSTWNIAVAIRTMATWPECPSIAGTRQNSLCADGLRTVDTRRMAQRGAQDQDERVRGRTIGRHPSAVRRQPVLHRRLKTLPHIQRLLPERQNPAPPRRSRLPATPEAEPSPRLAQRGPRTGAPTQVRRALESRSPSGVDGCQ